jgi:hypothetical protein
MSGKKGKKDKVNRKPLQFIENLTIVGGQVLEEKLGIEPARAREAAYEIALQMCRLYPRTLMYIPVALQVMNSPRNRELWNKYGQASKEARAYSAARAEEIALECGMTASHLYSIFKEMRDAEAQELRARQGALDLGGGDSGPAINTERQGT